VSLRAGHDYRYMLTRVLGVRYLYVLNVEVICQHLKCLWCNVHKLKVIDFRTVYIIGAFIQASEIFRVKMRHIQIEVGNGNILIRLD
jgi:hypothetical protein